MNKFLTSAAAVALLAGAAAARADDSVSVNGITFYGTVDVGLTYDTHGVPVSPIGSVSSYSLIQKQSNKAYFGVTENGMSQSKLGLKGAEDLGDGWTALFKMEMGISPAGGSITDGLKSMTNNNGYSSAKPYQGFNTAGADSSQAGQLFSRAAYGGISNDKYGTLTFGRQTSLQADLVGAYDPLYNSYAFALIGFSGTAAGSGSTEDARWNNMVKYLYSYGPIRVGGAYSTGGTVSARNDTGAAANIGFDYAGLSIDGVWVHKKDEVSAAPLTAGAANAAGTAGTIGEAQALGLATNNTLSGSIFDATSYSIGAKYKFDSQFTVLAGFEYIKETNPSSPLLAPVVDEGNYNLIANNSTIPYDKDLEYAWIGGRYQATSKLELAAAWYYIHQNSYGNGANTGCNDTRAGTCSGDENVFSALADYHFTKRFDVYGGVMYSQALNGLASGFNHNNNIAPSVGIRYTW